MSEIMTNLALEIIKAMETRLICSYYYMDDGRVLYVKEPAPLPRNRSLVKV